MWLAREAQSDAAATLLLSDVELMAPRFMLTEVANALCRKAAAGQFASSAIEPALTTIQTLGVSWTDDHDLLAGASVLALTLNHSVYDCLYLLLAQSTGGTLATADRKLASFAGQLRPAVVTWQAPH
jgi:hypothetical protein